MKKTTSSKDTEEFYNDLMGGKNKRSIAGKDNRYNAEWLSSKPSVLKYFDGFIKNILTKKDKILDFGCGPGTFSIRLSNICSEVVSVDIVESFIKSANDSFNKLNLSNTKAIHIKPNSVPYPDSYFDAVLLMDVVHHLEDINEALNEVSRVLKPNGNIIIYEPNKLNPIIYLIHSMDPNEHGLIRLGTPKKYKTILNKYSRSIRHSYNGIVLGPESKVFDIISAILNLKYVYKIFGWLNPKITVIAKNDK